MVVGALDPRFQDVPGKGRTITPHFSSSGGRGRVEKVRTGKRSFTEEKGWKGNDD